MLIQNEVEIYIGKNSYAKKYYEELGYELPYRKTKYGKISIPVDATLIIKVSDLKRNSAVPIWVQCDYCGKKLQKAYIEYCNSKDTFPKDSCDECKKLKQFEHSSYLQSQGLLKRNEFGYWNFNENILKELQEYLDNYNNTDELIRNKHYNMICTNLSKLKVNIWSAIEDLGYNPRDYNCQRPNHYYDNFELLEQEINLFIKEYGRFPTSTEMKKVLHIHPKQYKIHGNINKIKEKMNINTDWSIDDSGYYNRSSYEFMVAQWLIYNSNIPYLRDQRIFSEDEKNYLSDFLFVFDDNRKLHVEVWGFTKKRENVNRRSKEYVRVRLDKERLYKKYSIPYISIEPSVFENNSYNKIQEILYGIFQSYLDLNYKYIEQINFIPPSKMTDEELRDAMILCSSDGKTIPTIRELKKYKKTSLARELNKRYSYTEFAEKYNMETYHHKNNYWTKEKIFACFNSMLSYGKSLTMKNLKSINGLTHQVNLYGVINLRLEYYNKYYKYDFLLPNDEIKVINRIVKLDKAFKVTPDQQLQAQQILTKYNSTHQQST